MKMSLILLGALACSDLLRHRSAAVRHWVLAAAVACAAALPALEAVVPAWTLPIAAPAAFEPSDETSAIAVQGTPGRRSNATPGEAVKPDSQPATPSSQFDPAATLRTAWIAGTVAGLGILLVGLLRLTWLAAHARRVTGGRWIDLAQEVSQMYGLRRPVILLETDHPSLLVTWGLVKPKVLLPAAAASWSEERARVVLTHEFAHIRRGDWIVQICAELLRAVYWFNPLLWIACRRLRLESEHACDDEVMSRGVEGSDYANHLVALARALGQRRYTWFPAPAMARPSSLERRVRAMLNNGLSRSPLTSRSRAGIFVALFVMTVAVAAAQSGFVSFSGSVVDEHGRGIPATAVILSNEQRKAKYEVTAGESGQFDFVGLPAGDYALEVRGLGFKVFKDLLKVAGQNLQRNITLKLGSLEETIVVSFDPTDERAARSTPVVKEVAMPARKPCVASATGGRIVPPRKIRDVSPVYPSALRGTGVEGAVVMEARVGVDGYLSDTQIIGEPQPDLAQAAIAAVRDWRFTETLLNCEPTEVMIKVTTTFRRVPPPPPAPPRP